MIHLKISFLILFACFVSTARAQRADAILGKWKAEEKVLTIQIYKQGSEYRGKIVTYQNRHHPEKNPATQRDIHNPEPALRQRRLIGMDVLTGLYYDAGNKSWEEGTVYSPGNGKSYSASLRLKQDGKLEVRAYKGISLLGKTMTFVRE